MEIPPPPPPSVAESLKDLPSVETRAYLLYRETHIGVALVQTIVELTKKRGLISSAMEIRLLGEFDKVIQRLIVGSRLAEEPQMAFYPEQLVAFRNKDNTYTLFFRNVRVFQLFSFATVKNFLDLQVVLNEGKPLPKQKNVDSGRRTVNNPPKHSDSVEVLVEEVAAMKVTAYTPFNRIAQNRRASGKSAGTIVTFDENYDHKKEYYVVCGGETTDGAAVKEKKLSSRDRNILQKRQKAEEDAHR